MAFPLYRFFSWQLAHNEWNQVSNKIKSQSVLNKHSIASVIKIRPTVCTGLFHLHVFIVLRLKHFFLFQFPTLYLYLDVQQYIWKSRTFIFVGVLFIKKDAFLVSIVFSNSQWKDWWSSWKTLKRRPISFWMVTFSTPGVRYEWWPEVSFCHRPLACSYHCVNQFIQNVNSACAEDIQDSWHLGSCIHLNLQVWTCLLWLVKEVKSKSLPLLNARSRCRLLLCIVWLCVPQLLFPVLQWEPFSDVTEQAAGHPSVEGHPSSQTLLHPKVSYLLQLQ